MVIWSTGGILLLQNQQSKSTGLLKPIPMWGIATAQPPLSIVKISHPNMSWVIMKKNYQSPDDHARSQSVHQTGGIGYGNPGNEITTDDVCIPDDVLKICCWNINGLTVDKLSDAILGTYLKTLDVILLSETWLNADNHVALTGFKFYNYPRRPKHPNAKKDSGGLGIFMHKRVERGIEMLHNHNDVIAWIKLKKEFFGFKRDLFVVNVYFVPENSTHNNEDPFDILHGHMSRLPGDCHVLACGDYNARTHTLIDYAVEGMYGGDGDLAEMTSGIYTDAWSIHNDADIKILHEQCQLKRFSMDVAQPNSYGKRLVDMCKSVGLLIMNGRIGKDKGLGNFTCIDTTGKSVVDYILGSPSIFDMAADLKIAMKFPESDHIPLSLTLNKLLIKN